MGKEGEKHSTLSMSQKHELISKWKQTPGITQEQLAQWANSKFNAHIKRNTVSTIIKKFKQNKLNEESNVRRNREVLFPTLDDALHEWVLQYQNIAIISDAIIIEKGKQFASKLNIAENQLSLSPGWLSSFKKRHNIKQYKMHGESGSANDESIVREVPKLRAKITEYNMNDIFNFDETALFYKLEPDRTLANKQVCGRKQNKERITIALCTNSTGTEKMKPVVIGKSKTPRCFKGININNIVHG
ncbi:Pdc2p-like protein [Leptotrombidium deliense]|uniref:Pdc2p-like protein n=1 Tax=Leptotrombidium deliense TaxID=299467 RepID=A0A443S692_9ACAR|nr:Pdc2p-like protein [Leptotrombidium deliense]